MMKIMEICQIPIFSRTTSKDEDLQHELKTLTPWERKVMTNRDKATFKSGDITALWPSI